MSMMTGPSLKTCHFKECAMQKISFFLAWLLLAFSAPQFAFSWEKSEWLGIVEVSCGLAVIDADESVEPDSGECEECGGSGWLGDGTVRVRCQDCNPGKEGPVERKEAVKSAGPNF